MGTLEFIASWSEVQVLWGPKLPAGVCGEGGRVGDRACHRWGCTNTGGQHQRCALVAQHGRHQRAKRMDKQQHVQNLKLSKSQSHFFPI